MKACYCGCGAEAELEIFDEASGSPVDGDRYDQLGVCTKTINGQVIPRSHMVFEFDEKDFGNGITIYNRYGDVIHHGPFDLEPCVCLGKRVPI